MSHAYVPEFDNVRNVDKAVLVTGASTGIGYATVQKLARSGFAVFAGVRSQHDAERLNSSHHHVRSVVLDVRHSSEIAQAVRTIAEQHQNLHGVVNNAGIAVAGPLEFIPLGEFRKQFEINVFGALAVTQACLPLLRGARGRVVFISSISGQIAPPFVGPYASSKFALEALADSLRMELAPFHISVSVVQPGNVKTPIWSKGRAAKDEMLSQLPGDAHAHYGSALDGLLRISEHAERTGSEPEVVANAVLDALTSARPRARYPVGNPPGWQRKLAALMPESLRDRLIFKSLKR
jgi:NAD(P)-dependent dehydrogenase (short-subunit alcohol dehydrogenase family)